MATREDLHALVDWLPECAWEEANETMLAQLKKHDPVRYAFFTAPEDDPTEDEIATLEESDEDLRRGKGDSTPLSEVKERLSELP